MCLAYKCENTEVKDGGFGWKIFEECDGRLYTPNQVDYMPQDEVVEDDYPEYLDCCDNPDENYLSGFHLYHNRQDMAHELEIWRDNIKDTKYVGRKVQYWNVTATGREIALDSVTNKVVYFDVIVARKILVCKEEHD